MAERPNLCDWAAEAVRFSADAMLLERALRGHGDERCHAGGIFLANGTEHHTALIPSAVVKAWIYC